MKALVAFYSGTGNTAAVGRALAKELGADVEEIKAGSGKLGMVSSGFSSVFGLKTGIAESSHNPTEYDLVVVGTPTYGGKMSAPSRAYIEGNKASLPQKVAFFRVGGDTANNKGANVNPDMASLAGKTPVATADFDEKEVKSGEYEKKVKEFATKLK